MRLKNKIFILFVITLSSCFEKDIPVEPAPRYNNTVALDAGLSKQDVNYYSFELDTLLATIDPLTWDISLEDEKLKINGFRSMRVAFFTENWGVRVDTTKLEFTYLTVNFEESIWQLNANQNYVMDFGYDANFDNLGFYKFSFSLESNTVKVHFSSLDDSDFEEIELKKENFHFSLLNTRHVDVPFEAEYDVALGKYTDFVIFPDEQTDYLVYGAVLGNAQAVELKTNFNTISSESLDTLSFEETSKTSIGWDWKWYSLSDGAYTIREDRTYVVKAKEDFYYKLRFVDYYRNGVSGHPTLEYTLL